MYAACYQDAGQAATLLAANVIVRLKNVASYHINTIMRLLLPDRAINNTKQYAR